jgi:hypothetical protein
MLINPQKIEEGIFLNRFLESRLIKKSQNAIIVITGKTGSGKSYVSLRIGELWYKYHFSRELPIEHVCFSIQEVIDVLNSGKIKRGDLIILEEAGANLGSLDFQNKVQKVFTYILQSFRSMNLCLIMNLPYLSMLNKSARLLAHAYFNTQGIDYEKKVCKIKPFFVQVNQNSGKVYPKYPIIKINGRGRKIKRFNYAKPSENLIEEYEKKKNSFVSNLIADFEKNTTKKSDWKKEQKIPEDWKFEAYKLNKTGMVQREIAEIVKRTRSSVSLAISEVKKWISNKKETKN